MHIILAHIQSSIFNHQPQVLLSKSAALHSSALHSSVRHTAPASSAPRCVTLAHIVSHAADSSKFTACKGHASYIPPPLVLFPDHIFLHPLEKPIARLPPFFVQVHRKACALLFLNTL